MQELGDVAAARIEFEHWLERQPLAERTKSEYRRNVRVFLDWLIAGGPEGNADPLSDRLARDHAARDFRRWLKVERRAAASTANLALARWMRCVASAALATRTSGGRSRCARHRARSSRTISGSCFAPATVRAPATARSSC